MAIGDRENALAYYTRALEIAPNFALPYANRSCLYLEEGQLPLTLVDLVRAVGSGGAHCARQISQGIAGRPVTSYAFVKPRRFYDGRIDCLGSITRNQTAQFYPYSALKYGLAH